MPIVTGDRIGSGATVTGSLPREVLGVLFPEIVVFRAAVVWLSAVLRVVGPMVVVAMIVVAVPAVCVTVVAAAKLVFTHAPWVQR